MQKVLVTGAAGFVGQHLISLLAKKGKYKIVGLIRKGKILHKNKNLKYISGDILDQNFMKKLIAKEKPDVIIHLAAITTSWFPYSEEVFKVNLFGTINLYNTILTIKEKSNYDPRIIYVSTAQIYGNTENPKNITENAPINPNNLYAASKAAADRTSYTYSQSKDLRIVILRPFTHTGPGQKEGFFLTDMALQISKLEKDPNTNTLLVGRLDSIRDYLDVRDVVRAYEAMINAPWKPGEVFNISSGRGAKVRHLLKKLVQLSPKKISIVLDPKRLRPVDEPVIIGNSQKLRKLTGWKPEIKIETTIEDTLNYWRRVSS